MFKNYKTTRKKTVIGFLFLFVLLTSCSSNSIDNLDNLSEEEKIATIIDSMSIEEKVGQILIGRCPYDNPEKDIQKYHLGGLTFYTTNFNHDDGTWLSKVELKELLDLCQSKTKVPLLFAVDEEGGYVTRLSENPDYFPEGRSLSPREIVEKEGLEGLRKDTIYKSTILKELGFHVNFAPVADIATNPNATMYNRTVSDNVEEVSKGVQIQVEAMNEIGVGSVLKHFPGYGDNEDTHTNTVWDGRPYEDYINKDYLPFKAGIDAGCQAIMLSHIRVKSIDSTRPASLSPLVIKELREKLNFEEIIMTDDIAMGEMMEHDRYGQVAVEAFLAGNDMIITSNYKNSYEALLKAVQSDTISMEQLEKSIKRIIQWKLKLGIIE